MIACHMHVSASGRRRCLVDEAQRILKAYERTVKPKFGTLRSLICPRVEAQQVCLSQLRVFHDLPVGLWELHKVSAHRICTVLPAHRPGYAERLQNISTRLCC